MPPRICEVYWYYAGVFALDYTAAYIYWLIDSSDISFREKNKSISLSIRSHCHICEQQKYGPYQKEKSISGALNRY